MNIDLGEAVALARKQAHLKQEELAAILGVHKTAVTKIESGERCLTAIELLSLSALFGDGFEFRTENVMSDIIADTAARVRSFLALASFTPTDYAKRKWLRQALVKLDNTYVGAVA